MKIASALVISLLAASAQLVNATPTIYNIDIGNTDLSPTYPSPYGTIQVDLTDSTHATITFTGGSAGGFTYLFGGNGMADVNVNSTDFSVSILTPGSTTGNGAVNNLSSFGDYNLSIDNHGGFSQAVGTVKFTLTDNIGAWTDSASVLAANNLGYFGAAHIFVVDANGGNPKTGYAADSPPTTGAPDGGSTMALLGTGLVGLGLVRRAIGKKN